MMQMQRGNEQWVNFLCSQQCSELLDKVQMEVLTEKVDPNKIRETLKVGIAKLNDELVAATMACVEDPSRENKMKASQARKRYKNYENALKMSDEKLIIESLAGNIFK